MSRTCPLCRAIHCGSDTVAIGRFDPSGPLGYRLRRGGRLYATRYEAEREACRARQN